MPATWLPRSANNLNCLSQRLRIPLLAPQFPRPRAYPQRHPAYFSTSSRHLDPQPEPKAETQPESPPDEGDQLLQALQDVRDGNRNRKLVRQHFSRNARNDSGPQKVRRMLSNAEAKGSALRVQKKPELPPPDYVGQYIHLLKDIYAEDRLMPWYEESLKLSLPLVRLNQELEALADYLLPSEKERVARNCVAEDVLTLFSLNRNKALQGFGLEAFGSEVNSLATITSDLDFRLFDQTVYESEENDSTQAPRFEQRKRLIHALTQLRWALKHIHQPPVGAASKRNNQNPYLFQTPVLLHARYPLIETTHRPTNIDIQIVCCNDPSHSLRMMDKYLEEIPYIQTLYVVLRRTLAVRGLTDVFNGGIGSYTLFYMIVAALKHGQSPMPSTVGEALLQVLGFYTAFDSDKNWMSIDPLQITQKKQPREGGRPEVGTLWPERPYLLSIRDPADPTNDLPRQSFAWRHIRTTFAVLRKELSLRLKTGDERLLLVPFVGRWFEDVKLKREALLRYHRLFSIGKIQPIEQSAQKPDIGLDLDDHQPPAAQEGQETLDGQQAAEPAQASSASEESQTEISEQRAEEPAQESVASENTQTEPVSEQKGV
ncbi:hypothetical protein HDK77DRAFT_395447 [Phyllosticta capitalensis]|uniref:Poly(A) RNA polymerase mitochondrial-like central palm domain-containing protein n=1 Tax=Phyllosticta capitalensis TaxID=121624 RepID=A0ABR1YEU1_9PEZI